MGAVTVEQPEPHPSRPEAMRGHRGGLDDEPGEDVMAETYADADPEEAMTVAGLLGGTAAAVH